MEVFPGAGSGPHPALLVIHGGDFNMTPGSPKTIQSARDAAAAGFNAFLVEYRLSPRVRWRVKSLRGAIRIRQTT